MNTNSSRSMIIGGIGIHVKAFINFVSIIRHGIICVLFFVFNISVLQSQLPSDFQKVELLTDLTNATTFKFAPDGRIFIVDRYGELIIYKPSIQSSVSAGTVPVYHSLEDGLIGIAFDPNFTSNGYIYLHYSRLTVWANRVSRFTMNGDVLDLSSEIIMMEWATDHTACCHSAGDMDFDSQGNLYIATGDNTTHSDYAALDENGSNYSAENTSSNTNDLRGKILRITPQPDGSYTIPLGNLFPGGSGGLPEIYVMGARNPYRIFVDKDNTDWLFWGEVGPDANTASSLGPEGLDEINLTKSAGNFGWPYFSGQNEAYQISYASPSYYNIPAAPQNISIWNTGATNLPAAQPSWIDLFHESYMVGPRYYYDPVLTDQQRLPVEFDGIFFYFDFNTSQIWAVEMDPQGNITNNEQLAPSIFPSAQHGFIDMQVGPDGHLYILEYGAGCCPSNTGTGKLVRIDYTGIITNSSPVVIIDANPTNGSLPLDVNFSSVGTYDPDGDSPLIYEWDFETDGTVDSNSENPAFTYTIAGNYNAQLKVDDGNGGISTKNITINAGNNAATFTFNSPPDGGFMDWGDEISFDLLVEDVEDGSTLSGGINCNDISLIPSLGHLNHFHDDVDINGCPKTIFLDADSHDIQGEMDIFYVLGANYLDQGGLISFDQIQLHPKRKEAEFYDDNNGIVEIDNSDSWGGGSEAIRVNDNGYISFNGRNLLNINAVKYRVSSPSLGGIIEFRVGSPSGTLLATTNVPVTGSADTWVDIESPFTDPGGKNDLYFVFKNSPGQQDIFDLNYVEFIGNGVSIDNSPPEVNEVVSTTSTEVRVVFSEYVTQTTAELGSNYSIDNGVTISVAELQPDNRTVLLTTSSLSSGVAYNMAISNVQNNSGLSVINNSYPFSLIDPVRVNPGGPQVTVGGMVFLPDQYHSGGSTYTNVVPISGTTDDALYQTERFGAMTYEIPVTLSGPYDIRLHFAEIFFGVGNNSGGVGSRIFDVSLEGNLVLTNWDILNETQPATALIKEFNDVLITDGFLSVTFNSIVNNPKISAIEILSPDTFSVTPSITINDPSNSANVSQPFNVNFSIENWTIQQGGSHLHYYIDDVMVGPHYNLGPIVIDSLNLGAHTIKLELFESNHTGTGIFDEVNVTVIPPGQDNIWLEAECAIVGSNWSVVNDVSASGGQYLLPPSGNNYNTPPTDNNSIISFDFSADAATYKVYGLVNTPNGTDDSFWIRSNGGTWIKWNSIPASTNFKWDQVWDNDNGNALVTFNLNSGANTIEIAHREDGAGLDKLYITKTTNIPIGLGDIASNCTTGPLPPIAFAGLDQNISYEATAITLNGTGNDPDGGSITAYLWTQESGPNTATMVGENAADLTISDFIEGAYVFRLTVTDDENDSGYDDVTISVSETLWTDKDDIENYTGRHECSFVQAGNQFYLYGGRETADIDIYDYSTNSWSTLANPAPVVFNHFQGVEYAGLLWVIGAIRDNNFPADIPEDHIWAYDPLENEWIQGPEIPTSRKRGSAGIVVHNDKFYIVAGSTNAHDGGYVPWFDEYDPASGTWTTLADAPHARDHFQAAVIDGKLYAAGGRLSGGPGGVFQPYVPEVDVYDFTTQSWSTLPISSNIPTPRASAQVAVFNNKLLVIGGSVEEQIVDGVLVTGSLEIMEEFDPMAGTWQRLPSMVYKRRATQAIVSGNGIFTTSGSAQLSGGFQKNLEYYGEDNPVGSPLIGSTVSIPSTIQISTESDSTFQLDVSGGNVGVIVTSMEISGPDAGEFNMVSGTLSHGLIKPYSTHNITIGFTGTTVGKTATLTINYGESGQQSVALESINDSQPIASAGVDQDITLPISSVILNGLATAPAGGTIATYLWTQESGPNSATLAGQNTADLTASDLIEGFYIFRLLVTDDQNNTDFDEVTVNVLNQGQDEFWMEAECAVVGTNWSVVADLQASGGEYLLPPIGAHYSTPPIDVNSWVTFNFTAVPGTYHIYGLVLAPSGSDDSYWIRANGGTWVKWNNIPSNSTFNWHQVWDNDNGDTIVTFNLLDGANTIDIALREDGTGLDKLYVTSTSNIPSGLGGVDPNCIVSPQPPISNAGPDVEIWLPTNSIVLNGSGLDPDGGPVTVYSWTQESGPSLATLLGANTANLTVNNLQEGTYIFRLTVTDDENETHFDDVSVTVNPEGQVEIWLEAECAVVGSDWVFVNDAAASGGQYLLPPPGASYNVPPANIDSWVTFDFTASAGTYNVYGLVSAPSGSDDSFWIRANGGAWVKWNSIPGSSALEWHQVWDNDNGDTLVTFDLLDGTNTIDIAHREDGTGLDKLYVTSTSIIPSGLGNIDPNCSPAKQLVEYKNESSEVPNEISITLEDINITSSIFEVFIVPNPASNVTQIAVSNPAISIDEVEVYDTSGRLVKRFEAGLVRISETNYEFNIAGLEDGVYIVKLFGNNKSIVATIKLVVKKQ